MFLIHSLFYLEIPHNNGINQTGKSCVPDVAPFFPAGYPKRGYYIIMESGDFCVRLCRPKGRE